MTDAAEVMLAVANLLVKAEVEAEDSDMVSVVDVGLRRYVPSSFSHEPHTRTDTGDSQKERQMRRNGRPLRRYSGIVDESNMQGSLLGRPLNGDGSVLSILEGRPVTTMWVVRTLQHPISGSALLWKLYANAYKSRV